MKIMELHIPDDLAGHLPAEEVNVEQNIIDFLRSRYMKADNFLSLKQQYAFAAVENKEIIDDFSAADLEGWENDY